MASVSESGGAVRAMPLRATVKRRVASQREAGRVTERGMPPGSPAGSPGTRRQIMAGRPRANQSASVARASAERYEAACAAQEGDSQAQW